MGSLDQFVSVQSELLELERKAELEQSEQLLQDISDKDLEKRGIGINKLSLSGTALGLFGKSVVKLCKWKNGVGAWPLPANNLSGGDIVGMSPSGSSEQIASGIITKIGSCLLYTSDAADE